MLKCLGVLAILAMVTGGCGAHRAPAGGPAANATTASVARTDSTAVLYNPCEHVVYQQLAQALDSARIDDRDRNYLFEMDRLCREYSESPAARATPKPPLKQVQESDVRACTHPVYTGLRERVYTTPRQLTDQDHWYFHELDRACLQGKVAAAEKNVTAAAETTLKNASNRDTSRWLAFLAGLGALALNLFLSTS
jgi:hypothetical protein